MNGTSFNNWNYAFVGGGIIAGVFVERLLTASMATPDRVFVTDVRVERLDDLKHRYKVRVSTNNLEAAAFGDVVFVAVPPNEVRRVLSEVRSALRPGTVIISLAAAVPTAAMEEALAGQFAVLRIIPNTPSLIGHGMNPHCLGKYVPPESLPFINALLAVFGKTIRLDESLMNPVTALTAVGPTYIFPIIQTLTDVAVCLGLSESEARLATAQTVMGTAQLVIDTGKSPESLKLMIGTRTLKENEASEIFRAAINEAYGKIAALGTKLAHAA